MTARNEVTKAEYASIHRWLRKEYGRANMCENDDCNYDNPKRFEWALRKGCKHKRIRKNYIMLCPSCHRKYDFTEEIREKISIGHKGNEPVNKCSVAQYTTSGELVDEYDSIVEASKSTGIIRTGIMNNLMGISSHSGGYLWEYK